MANIFNIEESLLQVFDEIEELGGEITPEIEEKLAITKQYFTNKVKSYSQVITSLEADIKAIKEEKARLDALKKTKENTIERLKKIIIYAIENFGDTSKNGAKFVDYGTGKISVRTNKTVEVDENTTNRFVNRLITCFKWYDMQNQLDLNIINSNDILNYINNSSDEDDVDFAKLDIGDLDFIDSSIKLDVSINEILASERGFDILKALIKYGNFKIEPSVNKTDIKKSALGEEHHIPSFAKIVDSKTVTIK